MKKIWCSLKHALKGFSRDEIFTKASSLAFYAMLSLAPMLILLVTAGSLLGPGTKQKMIERITASIGPQAGESLHQLLQHAQARPMAMTFSAIAGLVTTLFAAIVVFTNLQKFLNHIFQVHLKKGFIFGWLYKRAMSLVMLLVMGVLLLCAVVAASILNGMQWAVPWIPQVSGLVINLVLFTLIFVMMFTVLPDVNITWKSTFVGGLITALLFLAGSWAIGMYLGRKGISSVYGAAGSLVILLLWIFYSGVIVMFGAELTESYLRCYDKKLEPGKFSEWDDDSDRKAPPPSDQPSSRSPGSNPAAAS